MYRNSEPAKYLHLLLVPLVQAKKWIDFCVYIWLWEIFELTKPHHNFGTKYRYSVLSAVIELQVELVSKELNYFGVIACLFRQIGGHSSRFVLFCSFWRLFTIKIIKSVKVFPFSFWKRIIYIFLLHKIQTLGISMQNGHQMI